jgi:hypothetical protein
VFKKKVREFFAIGRNCTEDIGAVIPLFPLSDASLRHA